MKKRYARAKPIKKENEDVEPKINKYEAFILFCYFTPAIIGLIIGIYWFITSFIPMFIETFL